MHRHSITVTIAEYTLSKTVLTTHLEPNLCWPAHRMGTDRLIEGDCKVLL